MSAYKNIASPECIRDYYERLYFMKKDEITKNSMCNGMQGKSIRLIPFKSYAESFELIDSNMISVVVARDDKSRELVRQIMDNGHVSERSLQKYTFSVYMWEFVKLRESGVISDYGGDIYCLANEDYYDSNLGVKFEGKDYYLD